MEMKAHPTSGYLVSEDGIRIVNPSTGFILSPTLSPSGYLKIGNYICTSGTVHQLVYEAWVKLRERDLQLNHKDGNKLNNHYLNLEEVTQKENTKHAYYLGLAKGKPGAENSMAKLSEAEIIEVIGMLDSGACNDCVGRQYGLHSRYVSLIRHGKRWKSILKDKVFPRSDKNKCCGCIATTIP